jgi:hypothetical protein
MAEECSSHDTVVRGNARTFPTQARDRLSLPQAKTHCSAGTTEVSRKTVSSAACSFHVSPFDMLTALSLIEERIRFTGFLATRERYRLIVSAPCQKVWRTPNSRPILERSPLELFRFQAVSTFNIVP